MSIAARTGSIRGLERTDVSEVAGLYERVFRSGRHTASAEMIAYFEASFLDHPWFDPDIPSLVAVGEGGAIVGFLGSHVRRMRYEGEPVRFACSSHFVVDPAARRRATGAFILAQFLRGPQDLTFTDGLTVRQLWERLGGRAVPLASASWIRILRPWQKSGDWLGRRVGRDGSGPLLRPVLSALDRVSDRSPLFGGISQAGELKDEELTPEVVVDNLDILRRSLRLHPDYDVEFLRWLFAALSGIERNGRFCGRFVRDGNGRPLGWYAFYLPTNGTCQVLQVAASEPDLGRVLDHLFTRAHGAGATAVQGRLEARLIEPLALRGCRIRQGEGGLIHSPRPELLCAVLSGDALLSRMDGEWWMGHHLLPFGGSDAIES
jgi:hypothetical protein